MKCALARFASVFLSKTSDGYPLTYIYNPTYNAPKPKLPYAQVLKIYTSIFLALEECQERISQEGYKCGKSCFQIILDYEISKRSSLSCRQLFMAWHRAFLTDHWSVKLLAHTSMLTTAHEIPRYKTAKSEMSEDNFEIGCLGLVGF